MSLPALCAFVCLLLSQINPTKCVNPPKRAAGGKQLLEDDFERNGSEKQTECAELLVSI